MKVTVNTKKENLSINEMETGTVFEYKDGSIGLKLCTEGVLLLSYTGGNLWLDLAKGYLTMPVEKVLGQLTEIIVE